MAVRQPLLLAAGFLLGVGSVVAQPPPVELFAANAEVLNVTLSPDGRHLAVTRDVGNNERRLQIVTTDSPEVVLTEFGYGPDHHAGSEFWVSNERLILQTWKNTGYLDGSQVAPRRFAVNIDGSNRQKLLSPFASSTRLVDRLRHDPDHVLAASAYAGDDGQIELKRVNVHTGRMRLHERLPDATPGAEIVDVGLDSQDRLRFALEWDLGTFRYKPEDDVRWLHFRAADGEWRKLKLQSERDVPSFGKIGFATDDRTFYFLSNYDQASGDTLGAFALDTHTGEIRLAFRHPRVNVQDGVFGPLGEVLGLVYSPDLPRRHWFDDSNRYVQLRETWAAGFPGQDLVVNSWAEDGSAAVLLTYSDRNAGQFHLWRNGSIQVLASVRPGLDPEALGKTRAFDFDTRDGTRLQGFLTAPPGSGDDPLPMVVWVHGGPFGSYDIWGYDSDVQLLASRGIAVLQVNFRGSGNYGQDFIESGFQEWGGLMQDDVTDATRWAIEQGIADASRICIGGASYGGFAALSGVIREPGLYRCAIGIAGIYSLPMFRKKGDYRSNREGSDAYLDRLVGRDRDELEVRSLAFNVEGINAGLLLIHGQRDSRVPIEQAEFLRRQLDAAGKPYTWLVRDEGHGFTRPANRLDQYRAMEKFLLDHLGDASP